MDSPDIARLGNLPEAQGAQDSDASLIRILLMWRRQIMQACQHAEAGAEAAVASFGVIAQSLDMLSGPAPQATAPGADVAEVKAALDEEMERMLTCFQTQDRLNQMLHCVCNDIQRLADLLSRGADIRALQAEPWLAQLDASYTMAEQRAVHAGEATFHHEAVVEFF